MLALWIKNERRKQMTSTSPTKQMAKSIYKMLLWEEKSKDGKGWQDVVGTRAFTHADVKRKYEGDMEGEGTVEFLMFYNTDGSSHYVGIEDFVGSIGGKKGRFAVHIEGYYKDQTATATCFIIPNSGTDELAGIRGEAKSVASGDQPNYGFDIEYWFEKTE
jgi:hypothetical protein